jgi:hypothetical protein
MDSAEELSWFRGNAGQYLVRAGSLDDVKDLIAAKNLAWDSCGVVDGLLGRMPPGFWAPLPE